jgi:hypothetical protein
MKEVFKTIWDRNIIQLYLLFFSNPTNPIKKKFKPKASRIPAIVVKE